MENRIIEILAEIKDDADFSAGTSFVDEGLLTSLDVIMLVGRLCDEFDISIPAREIIPANFNSVAGIAAMVQRIIDDD